MKQEVQRLRLLLTQKEEPSMHAYQLFRTLQVTLEQNTCFMSRDLTYERMTLVDDASNKRENDV